MVDIPRRSAPVSDTRRGLARVFWLVGFGLLLVWGLVHAEAAWWDAVARWRLDRAADSAITEARDGGSAVSAASPSAPDPWSGIADGDLVGRVEIPRLGLDAAVFHGVDEDILRRAVGHVPGTALPGQGENVGLAGHRDTFFRALRDVRDDDLVILQTPHGERHYRVVETSVVEADAVEVLAPTGAEALTLVTCYPFRWVGPAPRRFVVRAEAVISGV